MVSLFVAGLTVGQTQAGFNSQVCVICGRPGERSRANALVPLDRTQAATVS